MSDRKWHAWGHDHGAHVVPVLWTKSDSDCPWPLYVRLPMFDRLDSPSESASDAPASHPGGVSASSEGAGHSVSLVDSGDERCQSTHGEFRCVFVAGHGDYHYGGGQAWTGDEPDDRASAGVSAVIAPAERAPTECGPGSAVGNGALSIGTHAKESPLIYVQLSTWQQQRQSLAAAKAECERLRGELAETLEAHEKAYAKLWLTAARVGFTAGHERAKEDAVAACQREMRNLVECAEEAKRAGSLGGEERWRHEVETVRLVLRRIESLTPPTPGEET